MASRPRFRPFGVAVLLTLFWAGPAMAQAEADREADMFGPEEPADAESPVAKPAEAAAPATPVDDFGDPRMAGPVRERRDLLDDDKLQLGGLLYLRNGLFIDDTHRWSRQAFTNSNLTDIYFDARPNDRVRGFIRGRMLYSPVTSGGQSNAFLGLGDTSEPVQMQLDQLWLKFDIEHRVYITVGAQHVRWGATRLWNPVDAIYATRRNPLTLFDQRTGLPMLKLHAPFEVAGNSWNAYLIALADEATDLAHMGVAARLEAVVGTAEVGLTASKRFDAWPRLGLDLSAGVWEFDLTGEFGLRFDDDGDPHWQASGGLSWSFHINDEDVVIIGSEYFHNPAGHSTGAAAASSLATTLVDQFLYGDKSSYVGQNPFNFFYMGKQYAALFAVAMGPGSWNDTAFTLSALANISDRSGLGRLDVSTLVLTDLRVEFYGAVHVGTGGEFGFYSSRLSDAFQQAGLEAAANLRPADLTPEAKEAMTGSGGIPAVAFPAPVAQVGINLRMSM